MAITISQIYSLRLRCGQYLLQAVQSFQLSHNKRELSVSDIKKKKQVKNKDTDVDNDDNKSNN